MFRLLKKQKIPHSKIDSSQIRGFAETNLKLFQLFGLWPMPPTQAIGRCHKIWLATFPSVQLAGCFYTILTQIYNIHLTWGQLSYMCEFSVSVLQLVMCFVKTAVLVFNGKGLQKFVERIDKLQQEQALRLEDRLVLQETQAKSKEFTVFYTVLGLRLICVIMFGTTSGGYIDHEIPYRYWFPYDSKKSPMFELTLLTYMILTSIDYFMIGLLDVMFMAMTMELMGQFKMLYLNVGKCLNTQIIRPTRKRFVTDMDKVTYQDEEKRRKLKNINKQNGNINIISKVESQNEKRRKLLNNDKQLFLSVHQFKVPGLYHRRQIKMLKRNKFFKRHSNNCKFASVENRLAACVRHHLVLVSLVAEMEVLFQPALVVHFVCNVFCGLSIPYIITKDNMDVKMLTFVALCFVAVAEFATYCWFCTRLTTESAKVGAALYECPWWNASARQCKLLQIFLLHAQVPVKMTVAKIYPMSMESFTKVMNAAYSFFKVAHHMTRKWTAPISEGPH